MSDAEELPVVVNPRAGAGKAQRRLPTLVATLQAHGARPVVHPTEGPGHATELVRDLLRGGAPGVAVVGGDGTVNEAVNGFFDDEGRAVAPGAWLGPLPCGTGGDFRKTVGIPEDTAADAPPLLPPGVRSVFHGFRVVPNTRLSVAPFQPNSGLLVRPISTAPACLSRATSGVSSGVTLCSNHFEPNVVRSPSM